MWIRVDNRLIHGQVIEGWLPYTGARHLVVANDALAIDFLRQEIMSLAVSRHVDVHFIPVDELAGTLADLDDDTFVLFESCPDVGRAASGGMAVSVLNIGNIHYAPGKHQIYPNVALSDDDIAILRTLVSECLTRLDFRAVPTEAVKAPDEYLF